MRALAMFVVAAGLLAGQETREDPLLALRPVLAELRAGAWDAGKTRTLIDQLVKLGHPTAANWWASEAEAAMKAGKLGSGTQALVSATRAATQALGAGASDRLAVAKLVRHVESALADRNYDEAGKPLALVDTALVLVPDPPLCHARDALKKKLASSAGDNDVPNRQRRLKDAGDLAVAVRGVIATRLDHFYAEYAAAGCRAGRLAIRAALVSFSRCAEATEVTERILRLNSLARGIEKPRMLRLALGATEAIAVFRDGAPLVVYADSNQIPAAHREAIEIPVLDGDLIQLDLKPFNAARTGYQPLFVLAASATVDGVAVPTKAWFKSVVGFHTSVDPELVPLPGAVFTRDPAVCATYRLAPFPAGQLIVQNGIDHTSAEIGDSVVQIETAFATMKLIPTWFAVFAQHCVAVLKVPAPG